MCTWEWWCPIHRFLLKGVLWTGITLMAFDRFPRVESFPAVYPTCLEQMLSKHKPSPRVGLRRRYQPNGDRISCCIVDKFQCQGQEIRSLRLCVGEEKSKTSLGKEANGGVRRVSAILNVVVTGANRGLGFAIADRMAYLGHRVVLACRSECEGRAALDRLCSKDRACFHRLDVTCTSSLDTFGETCVKGALGGKVDVLFNNAAVCLSGSDSSVLEETLAVNFYGALGVIEACLPAMAGGTSSEGPTVVWVSSGEGELCFLSSKWQELLGQADTVEEIKSHLSHLLLASSDDRPDGKDNAALLSHDTISEIAFGPTPAYSLSKASANAVVRAWAPDLAVERGVRLVAVCPGDVLTGMMSEEELRRGNGVSPEEAALDVVDVALRAAKFPAGRFYRSGKEIRW